MNQERKNSCQNKEHQQHVDTVLNTMPQEEIVMDLASLFKVFGDATRIKIIYSISQGELCVCDIADAIGMSQSAVSHQLKYLKLSRLIKSRKEGKEVYYSLDDAHIESIFSEALDHVKEERNE